MKPRGFIALMSVIILSAVLLGLAGAANTSGFFVRFNILNAEYKRVALGLAESCTNRALLTLAQNYMYVQPTPLLMSLGADSCSIQSVSDTGTLSPNVRTVLITTSAGHEGAFSTVVVEATVANPASGGSNTPITILSWQEIN